MGHMAESALTSPRAVLGELGRYALVSAVGLGIDASLLALLVSVGHAHYLAAASISFMAGGTAVYALSVTWVFNHRRVNNRTLEFSSFVALGVAGLLVNGAIMYIAVEALRLHFMFGKLVAAGGTFCTNFLLRRHLLFSPASAVPDHL
jgi:putative flippase GtrA